MQAESESNHAVDVTLRDSLEETTQTHLIKTTTESNRPLYGNTLELHTLLPVAFTLLIFLILVLCLRFHLYRSSYKSWMKRLRRPSRNQEGDNISVDEEMFKPPPEYTTAITMPKPCNDCLDRHQSTNSQKQCPCNNRVPSDDETQDRTCHCEVDDEVKPCTVTLNEDSSESAGNENSTFVILEHLQRMARNPSAVPDQLPTYEDYIKEFPDHDDHIPV